MTLDKKSWSLKKTGKTAELLIYGVIDEMVFWGDEVTPKEIDKELKAMGDVDEIIIRINSPGGNVFSGTAIYTMLKRHQATKTTYIDGLCASMASIIALASDKVIIAMGAMVMIHRPRGSARFSTSDEMRKNAEVLDKIEGQMSEIYSSKMGITAEEIKPLLDAETWYTADEAVESGFADEVEDSLQVAASIRDGKVIINGVEMDLSKFKNAPKLPEEKSKTDASKDIAELRKELKVLTDLITAKSTQEPPALEPIIPAVVATGRNIDLEIKSLELYQN